ncbi:ADP-ribosylglycohydrolase [Aureococcus anophagefferens]|nr:ADP-ribosylglycohydrolase [Aureococcus anophagefferens]
MGLPCRLLLVASAGLAGALDVAAAREDAARSDATRARRVDAIVAAFVADAAAMPLHWIYDTDDLAAILARERRAETPEFLPESHAPYYAYPPGEQTPFGSRCSSTRRGLGGTFDARDGDAYAAYYGPAARAARPFESYVDTATREFLANYAAGRRYPRAGGEDAETNAVAHVLPVAAARAGFDDFLESCEAAIRVVQDNDDAVAFGLAFARILEAACDFPFHIFTAPHMLLHNMSSLVAAVRETIVIGGENANRGSFVASILAAAGGEVPDAWLEQTARGAELDLADNALAAPLPDAAAAIANATFVDVAGNDVACSPAVAAWVRSREFGFGC